MKADTKEQLLYGKNVQVIERNGNYNIYRIEDKDGVAVLTRYQVFEGIYLVFNDVHRQSIEIDNSIIGDYSLKDVFEINHCKEGRIEFETEDGSYLYIKKGDVAINTKLGVSNISYFPLCHYHGVSIEINLKEAPENISEIFNKANINLKDLKRKFCTNNSCIILRENKEFESLFSNLYSVTQNIRDSYYSIKVLEILLILSQINENCEIKKSEYYNKALVATIKEIRNYIVHNCNKKITLKELSIKYNISLTNMKKCFHEVYGNSIHAYLIEYRIQMSAKLINTTDYDISTIAGMVGYDNPSKFSSTFKKIIGINPIEYRKNCLNGLM